MPQSQLGPGNAKPQTYTNESLQVFLEEEKKRMGIQEIIPEESQSKSNFRSREASSRDEAKENMRRMTSQMTLLNQQRQARLPPPVLIRQDSKPRLLSDKEESKPLREQENQSPLREQSLTTIVNTQGKVSVVENLPGPTKSIKSISVSGKAKKTWHGWTAPGLPGAGVIKNNQDWTDLWRRLDRSEQLPYIDFNNEMAVIIFGDAKKGHSPAIVSALEEGQKCVIRYRQELPKQQRVPEDQVAYRISVFPASSLPISFIKIP